MSQSDLLYYAQRRDCELRLAAEAASPEAASAHRMLAEIYLLEVKRLSAAPQRASAAGSAQPVAALRQAHG